MTLLDRHLLKSVCIPFVVCILTFSSMVIVVDLFNRLDEILKLRPPIESVFTFYLYLIPLTFVQTSPVALLVALLYSVGLLNKRHEITAMRASGVSIGRIVLPFFLLGCLVSALSFWINENIVPEAMVKVNQIKGENLEFKKRSTDDEKVFNNVALFSKEGDLYYAASYDARRKILRDLVVFRENKERLPVFKIQAQEARVGESGWILSRGSKYHLDPKGNIVGGPVFFVKEKFPSSVKPEDFEKAKRQRELMNYEELREHLKTLTGKVSPSVMRRIRVELHKRFAYPFANLVMILLGFPFVFREKRAAGMLRGIGISAVLCFSFYATFVIASNLGLRGSLPPWLAAWFANIFFGSGGLLFLWYER